MMNPRRVDEERTLVVALTGASGIVLGLRLLRYTDLLKKYYEHIYVVYTENATRVAMLEESLDLREYLRNLNVDAVYSGENLESPIASSSRLVYSDMVIIPASLNTVAKISSGIQDNLVTRAARNILRLRGRLVIVIRETPLSTVDLWNLYKLSREGATILPAMIAMYPKPKSVDDLLEFVVGKVLDVLGIPHSLYERWRGEHR